MNQELLELEPKPLWKNFVELTKIPRPSKHEKQVIDFLRTFAIDNGLEHVVDKTGNILILKPATEGMEDREGIILQSHVDMVPQKNMDKLHDFTKDPIEAYIEDGWVKAKGTTLGADNGIGVAAILAILESKTIQHGPLEALFTVDEETDLTGASHLEFDLKGKTLLNLDTEEEGNLYIGCAGGIDVTVEFEFANWRVDNDVAFRLSIKGLRGGHSGSEINLGRGNAIKLLTRFLYVVSRNMDLDISFIEGGNLLNAIPREAFADIVILSLNKDKLCHLVKEYEKIYREELGNVEPNLSFDVNEIMLPKYIIDSVTQDAIIMSAYAVPNGVIRMSTTVENLVETSANLAIISTKEDKVIVKALIRSSVDSARVDMENIYSSIFSLAVAENVTFSGRFCGWKSNINSPILKTLKEVYYNKFGKMPEIKAIHAGLECGVISGLYPHLDMISFGPNILSPHSPDEKVEIVSVQKFYDFLVEALEKR